jgi:K+-sensing histidine kinase KdpD
MHRNLPAAIGWRFSVQARAELERVRDDLTSMVVHDLKNPVNGIAMTAHLAVRKADALSDSQRRHLMQIERSSCEMMRLIQNLLERSARSRREGCR